MEIAAAAAIWIACRQREATGIFLSTQLFLAPLLLYAIPRPPGDGGYGGYTHRVVGVAAVTAVTLTTWPPINFPAPLHNPNPSPHTFAIATLLTS